MKIIQQDNKKIISVLGIPHSGTTIVSNIFNSMDNAFCLSEPHWTLISNHKAIRFDKTNNLHFKNTDDILPSIKNILKSNNNLQFAGLKETYRPKEAKMKKYLSEMLISDIVVFVFREPKAHYNSFKVMAKQHKRNPMPMPYKQISYMVKSFNSIYDETLKCKNKIIIVLEDLCQAGNNNAISYINKRSNGLLKIDGKFTIKPTNYIYGNHKANRSKALAPANLATGLLTEKDIEILETELCPKYNILRS